MLHLAATFVDQMGRGERSRFLYLAVRVEVAFALVAVHLVIELLEQCKPDGGVGRIIVEVMHLIRVHVVVVKLSADESGV